MKKISLDEIAVSESSYVDPNGFVFSYEDQILRAIRPEVENFYRSLFKTGIIDNLTKNWRLVESDITDYSIPEINCQMVIRHKPIKYLSYCVEWCPSMLKEAALTTLDLNMALLEHNCMLQDAYPWNVLFDSYNPVFIDLTSIVPVDNYLIWPAYQQFLNFFVYPLELCSAGKGKIARTLLYDYVNGLSRQDYNKSLSVVDSLKHPFTTTASYFAQGIEQLLGNSPKFKEVLNNYYQDSSRRISPQLRKKFLVKRRNRIENVRLKPKRSLWTQYYGNAERNGSLNFGNAESWDKKQKTISDLLDKLEGASVIDVGCNTGWFSLLAAQKKLQTIAIDSDEACVENLYTKTVKEDFPILPLLIDAVSPTPGFGFLATQFPSAIERFECDIVLALAVVHHMHITSRQSFDRIAQLLKSLGKKVIVEYVDIEDEMVKQMKSRPDVHYNFDDFYSSFNKLFHSITTFDSNKPTRRILLCE